jgi:NAD-dependent dihydropyrimidine dehydrogenase PreA subunit
MKREIITIDEEKCDGCGVCVPGCPEGALQIIDGKARLVSDLLCDGLGACVGECPLEAITIEEREAEPYDERKVMALIAPKGANTIRAHLAHLKGHGQNEYYEQAVTYLHDQGLTVPAEDSAIPPIAGGCPGARSMAFSREDTASESLTGKRPSQLTHWPIQMHLLSPAAPHFAGADVLLAADCVAFSLGDFHKDYLKGRVLGIACPKLDEKQEVYLEKLKALVEVAKITTLTVMIMQVPCCRGLLGLAQQAVAEANRKVPIRCIVVGIKGEILQDQWV